MNEPTTAKSSTPDVRLVVRASLRCSAHSSANRRRAQLLVCKWVQCEVAAAGHVCGRYGPQVRVLGAGAGAVRGRRGGKSELDLVDRQHRSEVRPRLDDHRQGRGRWRRGRHGHPYVVHRQAGCRSWWRRRACCGCWSAIWTWMTGASRSSARHVPWKTANRPEGFCDHVRSNTRTLPIIALAPKSRFELLRRRSGPSGGGSEWPRARRVRWFSDLGRGRETAGSRHRAGRWCGADLRAAFQCAGSQGPPFIDSATSSRRHWIDRRWPSEAHADSARVRLERRGVERRVLRTARSSRPKERRLGRSRRCQLAVAAPGSRGHASVLHQALGADRPLALTSDRQAPAAWLAVERRRVERGAMAPLRGENCQPG